MFCIRKRFHRTDQGPRSTWGSRSTWAAIVLLVLLTLALFRQIALTNLILSGVDAFTYFYPYRAYVARTIRNGQIPLWNPYLFLGAPALANPQTAVFYPLNVALSWLSAPRMVAWSIVLHVALAAIFAYLYARHAARLSPLAAFLGASAFAFGGFLSGQVEHVNQLSVSAWFPLLLLLWELLPRARWPALLGMGAVVGLGLLAGHAQSSYISFVGLGIYALLPPIVDGWRTWRKRATLDQEAMQRAALRSLMSTLLQLGFVGLVGVGLAAVQLLPTLELSRLSIRSGGMSYREAVAFSLKPVPRLLRYTFLPPWGSNLVDVFGGDFFTEYLAYVGVLPLLLAALAAVFWLLQAVGVSRTSLHELASGTILVQLLAVAGLGVFLALGAYNPLYFVLYKLMPGFSLFRVPARWLFLYAFGVAMLAGMGLQILAAETTPGGRCHAGCPPARTRHRVPVEGHPAPTSPLWKGVRSNVFCPRAVATLLVIIGLAELLGAAQALPFNYPTTPEAFSSLRTAPAHILAAQSLETAPGRFLSLSDITFDPGDLAEMQQMFRGTLSEKAIYDYIVCAKRQEIVAPNLPLAWQMYAVDGYDGGVLPLAQYVRLQRLFLSESEILTDGRLREGLKRIPPSRLLSILGVRYVITDKVHDVWIDDVFYDLAFDAVLGASSLGGNDATSVTGEAASHFTATALGVVSYLEGGQGVVDGTPVAEIHLTTERGTRRTPRRDTETLILYAGKDTTEGIYGADVAHTQARIGHHWRDRPEGSDYVARLHWETPTRVAGVQVVALPFGGRIHIRGMTLIDTRDGSNVPVILSTDGHFRQVHSGDVKVYEVLDALPRAYVVHQTQVIADDERALAAMANSTFHPAAIAILAGGREIKEEALAKPTVTVIAYDARAVTVQASLHAPGYLVLSDSWYPGWKATVDGQPADIERANLAFRAVYLPSGTHTVQFRYTPISYFIGLGISVATLTGVVVAAMVSGKMRTARSLRRLDV